MKNSVTTPMGITYDCESAEGCLASGRDTCHVIGGSVRLADLIRNHATRRMIHDKCFANRAERVPTPKVPVAEVLIAVLASPASRKTLVSTLSHGDVATLASDAIVLHELASSIDQHTVDVMSRMPGMCSALVGLVKNPVSPQVTNATLVKAYYLIFGCERMAACLLVCVVPDLLVDADKEANEKALAVLNSLPCGVHRRRPRVRACAHAGHAGWSCRCWLRRCSVCTTSMEFAVSSRGHRRRHVMFRGAACGCLAEAALNAPGWLWRRDQGSAS
ncbi:hypothetical protein ZWY2020_007411 [Hordeum vulgare]|nr:hypothetical protein ZWY2020_007411 [Hordeum vulgare]